MFCIIGCVSTSITSLNNKEYIPTNPEDVTIYLDEKDIPGEYEKIAIIYAKGHYNSTDEKKMYEKVREEAAKLGANGILVQSVKDPSTGAKVANVFLGTSANREGEMIAIWVKEK